MKNNNKKEQRSTCVICGKVRFHKYMYKINDLWVCYKSVGGLSNEYLFLNGVYRTKSKCSVNFLLREREILKNAIDKYNDALMSVDKDFKDYLIEVEIVRPDLTKKLQ